MMSEKFTPYNTGKIKIGSKYSPPPKAMDPPTWEEVEIQNAILSGGPKFTKGAVAMLAVEVLVSAAATATIINVLFNMIK